MIDWHDFVVVDTITFDDDDEDADNVSAPEEKTTQIHTAVDDDDEGDMEMDMDVCGTRSHTITSRRWDQMKTYSSNALVVKLCSKRLLPQWTTT
jgi:hypothetical protein